MVAMMNSKIDSPHLLFEFIQTNANSLVLVLDLLPRKDLVSDLEYLKRFYEDTPLESIKQELQKSPYAQRYEPPTLYIRCVTSPTSILYKFECPADAEDVSLDQIIEDVVAPAAHKVVDLWLHGVLALGKELPDEEVEVIVKRDRMIKTKGVEVDLSSNMPRLFGPEITDNVIAAFRKGE
jgi:red chlorophyll catabolite reductase